LCFGAWRMACRERRRRPRQSLRNPRSPIGIGISIKRRQRTTLNLLPDPVRLALPVTPPPPRPFDLEYDAASPETVQAAGPAPASYGSPVQFCSVQYSAAQHSNLTRGGAHAHAPLVVGRQPCDRQINDEQTLPPHPGCQSSLERAGQRSGSTSRPLAVVLVFLSRIPSRQKASISVFVSGEVGLSWPVLACGLDMSNLRRKL
jgi:hypothetical protein